MWIFALLLLMLGAETGGAIGDLSYYQNDAGYWFVARMTEAGQAFYAGPYVNQPQAQAAARDYSTGVAIKGAWRVEMAGSKFGSGWWASRPGKLAGPFSTEAATWEWIEEKGGV